MPKVSIILPCYNVEKYIAKSIQSVLDQTYTDFELLVVIDGSPDNSKAVTETFKDKRIRIFEKPNGGLSDARNFGLERAKGEFIYFMDSDDWIEPDLLADNMALIEKNNLNVVVFGYIQDDENIAGNVINSKQMAPPKICLEKGKDSFPTDTHIIGILGYAWNKIYRRSFLQKNNIMFEKGTSLIEDILFNSLVYEKVDTLCFNDKCYYHYLNRQVPTLMKKFHVNSFKLSKRRMFAVDEFLNEWKVEEAIREQRKAAGVVGGIRYSIHNLYAFKNQLSEKESKTYVKNMLNDPLTEKYIGLYKSKTKKDFLYKIMIEYKMLNLLTRLAKLTKEKSRI
ncbi:glycosyltransferase family 2 protein [Aequorivita marina]|uniref:glycosyltransferase family 2 protein n=1 Tax=Aequorivita marina TaxID=3073654 RepID=UPI0028770633|nr:glycosyltransferase family 2 protein [Aequorivita sp. S2608]MDS1299088.1 glycosyltransferase family 2 protein [Aequorivita sp. S2608]